MSGPSMRETCQGTEEQNESGSPRTPGVQASRDTAAPVAGQAVGDKPDQCPSDQAAPTTEELTAAIEWARRSGYSGRFTHGQITAAFWELREWRQKHAGLSRRPRGGDRLTLLRELPDFLRHAWACADPHDCETCDEARATLDRLALSPRGTHE